MCVEFFSLGVDFEVLLVDAGHLGANLGPFSFNFSFGGRTKATEFENRPLEVDCGPLGVNFPRLWFDCWPLGVHLGPL